LRLGLGLVFQLQPLNILLLVVEVVAALMAVAEGVLALLEPHQDFRCLQAHQLL
jgi:hypothetical protein